MRTQIHENSVAVWLSASETYDWGASWPCSGFRGKRLFAAFDRNGLEDYTVDGREGVDVDADGFSACIADHLKRKLPTSHPAYDVAVGQFLEN